jgi:hypothetical protein
LPLHLVVNVPAEQVRIVPVCPWATDNELFKLRLSAIREPL